MSRVGVRFAVPLLAMWSLAVSPDAVAAPTSPEPEPLYIDAERLKDSCNGWLKNPCAGDPPSGGISVSCLLGLDLGAAAEPPCNPWMGSPPVRVELPGLPTLP